MGQLLGLMGIHFGGNERSDLSDEQVEETRMLTSLPVKEIHRIRKKYQGFAVKEDMSQDEFNALPVIAINPLKDRLVGFFELTHENNIPFTEFARFMTVYSYHSSQESKLREAFRIHDFDGDGKISRDDLRSYMKLVYPTPADSSVSTDDENGNQWEMIVNRVMEEASSSPAQDFLAFEDFVKVIQPTDYESRLIIPF